MGFIIFNPPRSVNPFAHCPELETKVSSLVQITCYVPGSTLYTQRTLSGGEVYNHTKLCHLKKEEYLQGDLDPGP